MVSFSRATSVMLHLRLGASIIRLIAFLGGFIDPFITKIDPSADKIAPLIISIRRISSPMLSALGAGVLPWRDSFHHHAVRVVHTCCSGCG